MNKLLVTTSLEKSWGTNEEIVFLGEWCKIYGKEHLWENRKSSVIEYHWADRKKAYNDFQYIRKLYALLINEITCSLNEYYRINYSAKEYSIIYGYWLMQFIVVVFDRFNNINYALKNYHNLETIIFDFEKDNFIPSDTAEAFEFFIKDSWNHVLISEIINFYPEIKSKLSSIKIDIGSSKYSHTKINLKQKLFKKFIFFLFNLFSVFKFNKNKLIFFIARPFSKLNILKLLFYFDFKIASDYPSFKSKENESYDSINLFSNFKSSNTFEIIIIKLLSDYVPKSLRKLSFYKSEKIDDIKEKFIVSTNAHFNDDIFKHWAANEINLGAKLIIGQHGGGPFHAYNGATFYEHSICDNYLTCGKASKDIAKFVNAGQYWARLNKDCYNSNGDIALVTASMPRYAHDLRSMAISSLLLNYFNDLFTFYENLTSNVTNCTSIRLYSKGDYGWNQRKRWKDRFRDIRFSSTKDSFQQCAKQSRLVVATYNCTTYCETLAANIPTLIFWDESIWQMDSSSKDYFDLLKEVGIFHDNPINAANYLNEIYADTTAWWSDTSRQKARRVFCEKYAYREKNQVFQFCKSLNSIV